MLWIALLALVPFVLSIAPECKKTIITHQRTIETQGVKLNFTVSECADAETHITSKTDRRSTVLDTTSFDLAKRSESSQCKLPAPHCVCDYPCTDVQCFGPRYVLYGQQCQQLGLILMQLNGTFLIEPGQTVGVGLLTCTFNVYNNEATGFVLEYCYKSLGQVGYSQLYSNCPNKEGYCGGGTLPGYSMFYVEQLAFPE